MTRWTRSLLLVSLVFATVLLSLPARGQKEKSPTIRDIMGKLNRGPNSLTPTLGKDLRDSEPDWELIQESSAEYVKLTRDLGKNTPPLGEKTSWERLTKAYAADATALDAAARKKDRRGASAALARINKACNTCHDAHKKK